MTLTLLIVGSVVYSNTLKNAFVFDDFQAIVNNPSIRSLDLVGLWNAFNTRFVVGVSLALNYAIGKEDVLGYHLFNTSIHILNAFLVYKLISLTPKASKQLGFLVALIFLVHPLQTQAVTYIWQRSTSLAAFFYIGALVFYVKGRLTDTSVGGSMTRPYYGLCLLSTALGMFTKEIAFTIPLAIALYEFVFLKQGAHKARPYVVWVLLGLSMAIIPWTIGQTSPRTLEIVRPRIEGLGVTMTRTVSPEKMSRNDFILTELNVLRTYLRLFVLPIRQNADYDYPKARSLDEPGTLASLLLLLSLFGAACLLLKKYPLLAFGLFWFFLTVSLEAFIVQEEFIFEHRMYLPMAGLSLFLAAMVSRSFKNKPRAAAAVLLAIAACFSFLTYQRNFVWKSEFTLWDDVIKKSPNKARGYNGRGDALVKLGLFDQALPDYTRGIELKPHFYGYAIRGYVYGVKGLVNLAIADFTKTIELNPDFAMVYYNRANLYFLKKEYARCWEDVKKAESLGYPINPQFLKELEDAMS